MFLPTVVYYNIAWLLKCEVFLFSSIYVINGTSTSTSSSININISISIRISIFLLKWKNPWPGRTYSNTQPLNE